MGLPGRLFLKTMNVNRKSLYAFSLIAASIFIGISAEAADSQPGCPRPYGGYCRGPRWGWYGANQPVKTTDEARKHLEKYYEGKDVTIGTISEKSSYFEAVIKNKDNATVDRVVIDKRTGRIRSVY